MENNRFINYMISLIVSMLGSSYFFTNGYIRSLGIPVSADFIDSGYFLLDIVSNIFADKIFYFFYTVLPLTILVYFLHKFSRVAFYKYDHTISIFIYNLKNIKFKLSVILALFYLISCLAIFLLERFEVRVFDSSTAYNTPWYLFAFVLFFSVFIVPLFLIFLEKDHSLPSKKFLYLVAVVLCSCVFSYRIGHKHSANFINFPKVRTDPKDLETKVFLWRDSNYTFYVKCKTYGQSKIYGKKGSENVFVGYIDKSNHSNVCN